MINRELTKEVLTEVNNQFQNMFESLHQFKYSQDEVYESDKYLAKPDQDTENAFESVDGLYSSVQLSTYNPPGSDNRYFIKSVDNPYIIHLVFDTLKETQLFTEEEKVHLDILHFTTSMIKANRFELDFPTDLDFNLDPNLIEPIQNFVEKFVTNRSHMKPNDIPTDLIEAVTFLQNIQTQQRHPNKSQEGWFLKVRRSLTDHMREFLRGNGVDNYYAHSDLQDNILSTEVVRLYNYFSRLGLVTNS